MEMGQPTVTSRRLQLLVHAERAISLLVNEVMSIPYSPATRWAHGACTYCMTVLQEIKAEIKEATNAEAECPMIKRRNLKEDEDA